MTHLDVTFNDTEYRFSHGRAPRGRGSWAFAESRDPGGEVTFSPSMTFGEACRWVKRLVKDQGGTGAVTLYVLP